MRKLVFSIGLIFLALVPPAHAFEVENHISVGPADARRVLRVISTGDAEFLSRPCGTSCTTFPTSGLNTPWPVPAK